MPGSSWTLALLIAVGSSAEAPPTAAPSSPRLATIDKSLGNGVRRAVADAHRRLAQPACQRVLDDFRDGGGRTLRARIDAVGQTPPGYLSWMAFYSGDGHGSCRHSHVVSFTVPGSRVVHICQRQFREKIQSWPGLAAAYIIHEMLHSLGLGENPPSSTDITRRVIARCGR